MADEKIVLFDFCGTMINFQSADAYVQFVKEHVPNNLRMKVIEAFRIFLVRTHTMRMLEAIRRLLMREGYLNKKMLLSELKGMGRAEMEALAEKFYNEKIRPNYISEVIEAVKKHQAEGYRLLIVSGGYDIYLKYPAQEFGFEKVIATCLDFKDEKFTGHYKGEDCMKGNKITMLKNYFDRSNLRDCDSIAYSDSKSDVPLLKYCRRGVAVCRNCPPPPPQSVVLRRDNWIKANGFEVLTW